MAKQFSAVISALLLSATPLYASANMPGHFLLEGGAYYSTAGKSQFVNINGLIGNQFNLTSRNDTNSVFGVGYLFDGLRSGRFGVDYGVNIFYLAKTKVSGTITQENLFTNLAYDYYISHLPVYLFAKGFMDTGYKGLAITVDAGVGANFMDASLYQDKSRDGVTVPDRAFAGDNTTSNFTFMAGVGVKGKLMHQVPVEIGYRYFDLDSSSLKPRSSQILNKLKTGNTSAQAIIVTVSI